MTAFSVRSRTAASSASRSAASSSARPTSRRVEPAGERGRLLGQFLEPERLHRLAQPAQVDVAERLEPARARSQTPRQLVDGDLARRDLLLQPRRDDHGRTGRERLVRAAAREHLARREPDPHLQAHAEIACGLVVETSDGVANLDCRPRGAERVVLVRERRPEHGHDGVADELLDHAAVPRDGSGGGFEVPAQQRAQRFRVERDGEPGRIGEVGVEDRRELPLWWRRDLRRTRERLVLAEDRRLEVAQLWTRLDAELLDERVARIPVCRQRVGLPALPVEGEHQLRAETLPHRVGRDERLELRHEPIPTECEVGVDPQLDRARPQPLEPCDLGLRERLVREVGKRRATPERQRLRGAGRRPVRIACSRLPRVGEEPLEAHRVDRLRVDLDGVARRSRDDRGGVTQRGPQAGDLRLERVPRPGRRRLLPEVLDEPVDGDDPAAVDEQVGEQRALLRRPQRHAFPVAQHLERPQEPELDTHPGPKLGTARGCCQPSR